MSTSALIPNERVSLLSKAKELHIATPSWMYPFKGIYYLLTHRFLWPLIKARFILCAILSIFVYLFLFIFTYIPQVALLSIFQGGLAWVNAAFLVLGEGAAVIALLFEAFFVDQTLVKIVDSVLINEGYTDLVATRRVINYNEPNPLAQLGGPTKSASYSPFSLRLTIEFILYLPLNFIPVVGTLLFLIVMGKRAGPFHHFRYLKLLGMHQRERDIWTERVKWRYTRFGTVALALQYIPVLSMLFLLTTATGAALWAADLEKERRATDAPPAYVEV
ncbi:hypothetical protein M413DRAFT_440613 [Hebeloma cylindrosporum]|uniref:Outer spore wall protein RRT8 n=1 Tax=Hebeloma cylindrosporum TaxID=76867 RepID=A0A0C3CSN0_HEBCY|nr:hypothetical protein M413DRAFT_440613 [Hebeloma cylindrosporum h7]